MDGVEHGVVIWRVALLGSCWNNLGIFYKRRFQPSVKKTPFWRDWDEERRFKSWKA